MKKFTFLILMFCSIQLFAQHGSAAIKIGSFAPEATESGFIVGYEGGMRMDRNLVIGWSVDWFHKNYIDQSLISEYEKYYDIVDYSEYEIRAKTNIHDIPLMFTVTAKFPVNRRAAAFINGAMGAEVLIVNYRNFHAPNDDDTEWAFDFSWRIGAGMSYMLGRRSEIFGELTYHNSEPSWEYEVADQNTGQVRIFERKFDMSGVMGRIGIRFYY